MTQFKAGDKVRIIEGGWGIHPIHIGKIVTIHRVVKGEKPRYELKETLSDAAVHSVFRSMDSTARGESFELVQVATTDIERVREINKLIRELQAEKAALIAVITADLEL